jgi:serine phosphatase RsbU (regulator of sigma subunit)
MLLNNGLKERIKGKSFITAVLFEWDAKKNIMRFIGAGHDPLFHYHRSE